MYNKKQLEAYLERIAYAGDLECTFENLSKLHFQHLLNIPYENLDLIPSSTLMSGIEYELFTKWQRELILRKCLQSIKDSGEYDYILMDAPPTLGGWAMNLLCASDWLLIPTLPAISSAVAKPMP